MNKNREIKKNPKIEYRFLSNSRLGVMIEDLEWSKRVINPVIFAYFLFQIYEYINSRNIRICSFLFKYIRPKWSGGMNPIINVNVYKYNNQSFRERTRPKKGKQAQTVKSLHLRMNMKNELVIDLLDEIHSELLISPPSFGLIFCSKHSLLLNKNRAIILSINKWCKIEEASSCLSGDFI